ncbi:MAG: hypothetical protein QGH33_08100, partial [Pirellulaceae bacterium]|nr:hypothetical protein [Pirellulaceae bacterium]
MTEPSDKPTELGVDEALAIACDSKRWPDFGTEADGAANVFTLAMIGGLANHEFSQVAPFCAAFFHKSPKSARSCALETIVNIGEHAPHLAAGMMLGPFLFFETDHQLLSRASLCFCVLAHPDEEGVTTGAKMVIEMIEKRNADASACGSLAGGILLLGDARFRSAMNDAWSRLDLVGRHRVAIASTGYVTHIHIQFLLDKLDDHPAPDLFGNLAGTLGRLAKWSDKIGVMDVERVIPVS